MGGRERLAVHKIGPFFATSHVLNKRSKPVAGICVLYSSDICVGTLKWIYIV